MSPISAQDLENKALRQLFLQVVLPEYGRDPRIDEAAQRAIVRLAQGDQSQRTAALVLLSGVKSGVLGGIHSTAGLPAAHPGVQASSSGSIPASPGAMLSGAIGAEPPPIIVFREPLGDSPQELDRALFQVTQGVWRTVTRETVGGPYGEPDVTDSPWSCAFYCSLCAAAILDGIPGDEVYPCLICLTCIADPSS